MAFPTKRKQYICYALLLTLLFNHLSVAQKDCVTEKETEDKMDNARLVLDTSVGTPKQNVSVTLFTQREECVSCGLQETAQVVMGSFCAVMLDTRWKMRMAVNYSAGTENYTSVIKMDGSCGEHNLSQYFKEYGNYTMYISLSDNTITCKKAVILNNPYDSNIPIFVAMGIFVGVILIYVLSINCYRHRKEYLNKILIRTGADNLIDPKQSTQTDLKDTATSPKLTRPPLTQLRNRKRLKTEEVGSVHAYMSEDLGSMQTNINPVDNPGKANKKERLRSLDTFRGISIVVMIFVNYGGGGYWFFKHSRWNGLTIADLVFPWFIWIMGTSMAFSYKSLLLNMTPKWKIFLKIFKRSCILFLLGLVINSDGCEAAYLPNFRIPGVLQRFAGTYLIIATMHMFFARTADTNMHKWWNPVRDIIDYWFEWIVNLVLVAVYVGVTFGLDVPGCPTGYLGPGGLDEGGKYWNCTGGAAGYIDRQFFGDEHIYHGPTCKEIYKTTVSYDPEGLLGTLTSCFMCFLGLQAGKILMIYKEPKKIVVRYCVWGFVLCLIAGILCEFKRDGGFIPINKNLWSLSFVLCLAGFAFFLLAACYLTIDVWKIWNGAPFYYPGMNPLVVYVGHEVMNKTFPVTWSVEQAHSALLPMDIWGTLIWMFVAYQMYRMRIFISV